MPLVQGRKRRAPAQQDDSPESSASEEPAAQRRRISPDDDGDAHATQGDGTLDQMAKKLVRLALSCEYQRKPIRRGDISEKVLGTAGRQFKAVFQEAQLQLQTVFGMMMVELPGREKVTLAQRRAAQKTSQQSKTATQWILTSTLPSKFHDPLILPPPKAPTAAEESTYTALYTLLIALISLSGGTLPDSKMERYLTRLNLQDNTPLDGFEKTERLLKRVEKDGYVVKVKESAGGEETVDWVVGPRGKVEVGEDGVGGLARAVYGDMDEEDEEELDRKIARSLGVGERKPEAPREGEKKKRGRKRKSHEAEEQEEGQAEDSGDD